VQAGEHERSQRRPAPVVTIVMEGRERPKSTMKKGSEDAEDDQRLACAIVQRKGAIEEEDVLVFGRR